MPSISIDIVAAVICLIGGVIWFVRLEGKVNNHEKEINDHTTRLNSHSERINNLSEDGNKFVSLVEGIRKDMQSIVTNIRWILKVAKIEVPDDIFGDDNKK